MKLYDYDAPNPRRVRIFLAEKGLDLPRETVDLKTGEQFAAEFSERNPFHSLPVLELDDGTWIAETIAICRYIEDLHPQHPLFGVDAVDRALTEMWNRRVELWGFIQTMDVVRNSMPGFRDRALPGPPGGVAQIPELVARGTLMLNRLCDIVDRHLGDSDFVAGPRFSIADITMLVTVDFATRWAKLEVCKGRANLARWHTEVSARSSAGA